MPKSHFWGSKTAKNRPKPAKNEEMAPKRSFSPLIPLKMRGVITPSIYLAIMKNSQINHMFFHLLVLDFEQIIRKNELIFHLLVLESGGSLTSFSRNPDDSP